MHARSKLAIGIGVLGVLGWLAFRAGPDTPVRTANAKPKRHDPRYPLQVRRIDRETRAKMVDALAKLRDAADNRVDAWPSDFGPKPTLPADEERQYIRAAIKAIVPQLGACYERGLLRDPNLAGTVVVEFTIEGEPAVGGLIGDSTISDDSTILDAQVRDCIQETMFAIRIDPPAGGEIHVRYPFTFRPVF